MHYSLDQLDWSPIGNGWHEFVLTLASGDSAVNAASTKGNVEGPAKVTYRKAPDGGIEQTVEAS